MYIKREIILSKYRVEPALIAVCLLHTVHTSNTTPINLILLHTLSYFGPEDPGIIKMI